MKTVYECDHCGKKFDDWRVCAEHEKSHITPLAVVKFGLYEGGSKYPKVAVIRMSDGNEVTYALEL